MREVDLGSNLVEFYTKPIRGRLFVVGDLHGCYTLLMNKLEELEFNFQQDLLVSVGDLVDRGQENLECLSLINEPWFKAIRGNHEQMCIEATFDNEMKEMHAYHGGDWLYKLPTVQQQIVVEQVSIYRSFLKFIIIIKFMVLCMQIYISMTGIISNKRFLKITTSLKVNNLPCKLHYGIEDVSVLVHTILSIRL